MTVDKFKILLSLKELEAPYWDELENLEVTHKLLFALHLGDEVISHNISPYVLERQSYKMSLELDGYIDSNFYPINCGCLEPMCMGLSNGVIREDIEDLVVWRIPGDAGYKDKFKKSVYVFNKTQYDAELENVLNQVKKIEIENRGNVVVVEDFIYLRDFISHI